MMKTPPLDPEALESTERNACAPSDVPSDPLELGAHTAASCESDPGPRDVAGSKPAASGAAESDAPTGSDSLQAMVEEVRVQLQEIARREADLTRHDYQQDRTRRDLEQTARQIELARAELEAQHELLQRQEEQLAERGRRIDAVQEDLEQRERALLERAGELQQRERENTDRRASVDKLYRQALDVNERAQRQHEQAVALRKQLAGREAELKELAERLAKERAAFDADRALFEQRVPVAPPSDAQPPPDFDPQPAGAALASDDLAAALSEALSASEAEPPSAAPVEEVAAPSEPNAGDADPQPVDEENASAAASSSDSSPVIPQSSVAATEDASRPHSAPPMRFARGLAVSAALASIAAVVVGAISWSADPPAYHARLIVSVENDPPPALMALAAHATELSRTELADAGLPPRVSAEWSALRRSGRLSVRVAESSAASGSKPGSHIELTAEGADAVALEAVLQALVERYATGVASHVSGESAALEQVAWQQRVDIVSAEVEAARKRLAADEAALAALPDPNEGFDASCRLDVIQADYERATAEINARAETLAALRAQPPARGPFDPQRFEAALAEDPSYQEDLKELAAAAREYRTELAVAMVVLTEPIRELRAAAVALVGTLKEQRDLQPPPEVRAVLEQGQRSAEGFERAVSQLSQDWDQRRQSVERMNPAEQLAEVVAAAELAAADVQQLVESGRRLVSEQDRAFHELGERGDAGTRGSVIAALLRSEYGRIAARLDALLEASKSIQPRENVRLDANDRQIRNLRARIRDRSESIREQVQSRANAAAQAEHELNIAIAAAAVQEAQQERDRVVQVMLEQTAAQLARRELAQRIEHQRQRRDEAAGDVARFEAALTALMQDRPQPTPDSVQPAGPVQVEQVAGIERGRSAVRAGGLTFLGMLAACMMVLFVSRGRTGK